MSPWVEITFECIPLRSVGRLDIPIDASPKFRQRCERIKSAMDRHGTMGAYYLANGTCVYHLANHPADAQLEFAVEGTVLTDETDQKTVGSDLSIELARETCDWLTAPIVDWFKQSVDRAMMVEFDRYIAAGDLKQTLERIERLKAQTDQSEGYVGMYL